MKIVNFKLQPKGQLSKLLLNQGIADFHQAISCIQEMPYGVLSDDHELADLLTERKANCSAKHAFLVELAKEHNYGHKIFLVLSFYQMNSKNTPEIGNRIEKAGLPYLPEAHCYIFSEGKRYDFTGGGMSYDKIANTLLFERTFPHDKIVKQRDMYHQDFIKKWLVDTKLDAHWNFEQIWELREKCISAFESV